MLGGVVTKLKLLSFFFFFFNGRIIALQNFVFCQTPTWIEAVVLSAQSHGQNTEAKQRRSGEEIPLSLLSFSFQCSVCSFSWLNSTSLSSWQENLPWALSVRLAGQQIKKDGEWRWRKQMWNKKYTLYVYWLLTAT